MPCLPDSQGCCLTPHLSHHGNGWPGDGPGPAILQASPFTLELETVTGTTCPLQERTGEREREREEGRGEEKGVTERERGKEGKERKGIEKP